MNKYLAGFQKYSFLLGELTKKGIKLRYRRSYLGIVWTLLEPLLTMIVLTLVFSVLLDRDDSIIPFPLYVLSGRLLYSFFAQGTRAAMKSVRSNASMIKKVYVPKYMYPLSCVVYNFFIFLISLVIMAGTMLVLGVYPTIYLLQIFVPLILLFMLTFGVGMILATVTVFFRDMEYIWDVGLMLIMYTSAIFYYAEDIFKRAPEVYNIFYFNPLYAVIRLARSAISGLPMEMSWLMIAAVSSVASVLIGFALFYWKQDKFILHL